MRLDILLAQAHISRKKNEASSTKKENLSR